MRRLMNSESAASSYDIDQVLMYSGYAILGLIFIVFMIFWLCKGKKKDEKEPVNGNEKAKVDQAVSKSITAISTDTTSSKVKQSSSTGKQECSIQSGDESALISSSFLNRIRYEDLLQAPAELLGRGKYGSLYKVLYENGMTFVAKRIKGWEISSQEFMQRMWKIDRVKHPNVLPALAFFSSKQDKILVYEYQINGSLFSLLHRIDNHKALKWAKRLNIAASIAKALAFMHQQLKEDRIPHGNLKSSNILINIKKEACISEYGLLEKNGVVNRNNSSSPSIFKEDVYGFGMILLELLTGKKQEENENGLGLTEWVRSVFREEWTVEVFDRNLVLEGIDEGKMISLLHLAMKCVDSNDKRPTMKQVCSIIDTMKANAEEDDDGEEEYNVDRSSSMVEEKSIFWIHRNGEL